MAVAGLKRTVIPLAAAVVVALAAMGGLETMQQSPPAPLAELTYNAVAEGVDLKFHDAEGRIGYAIQAARQIRFNDDSIEWSRPSLQWYQSGGEHWRARAEQGFVAPAGDTVRLRGNVALFQQSGGGETLTLNTTVLNIDLAGETVTTDEPVHMIAGGLRQSAAGLVLDLPEDSLLMLGGVRGSHVRP